MTGLNSGFLRTLLVVLSCSVAQSASADEHAVSTFDPKEAKRKWDAGTELARNHDYVGACAELSQAYAWTKDTRILLSLALAEARAGRNGSALRHFRLYAAAPTASPQKVAVVLGEEIPALLQKTGRLQVEARGSTLVIIDDVVDIHSGERADVDPGIHQIVAVYEDGRGLLRQQASVAAGEETSVAFPNKKIGRDVADWASPPTLSNPAVDAAPSRSRNPDRTRASVSGGLAAGSLLATGAAVYFGLRFRDASKQADLARSQVPAGSDECRLHPSANCDALRDANRDVATDEIVFLSATGAAVALAAGAVVAWFAWPQTHAAARATWLLPQVSERSVSMAVGGTF